MKIGLVGEEFLQTERRTDGRTDIRRIVDKSRFSQFCKPVRNDSLRRVKKIE
jgi:hypothetical protein